MIINISGTNGSGKSVLIRSFLEQVDKQESVYQDGRSRPIGYDLTLSGCNRTIHLVGHYEDGVDTGGCDTITNIREVFNLIRAQADQDKHVVYEGAIVMNMLRGPELVQDYPGEVHVLSLTTPLAVCAAGVESRRQRKGVGVLGDKKNIASNYNRSHSYARTMRSAGAQVTRISRKNGLDKLLSLLRGE